MKKIIAGIAGACLLAAPSTLLAQSAKDMMTPEQIETAGALLKTPDRPIPLWKAKDHPIWEETYAALPGLAVPLDIDLKTLCPDFYQKNVEAQTHGARPAPEDAVKLVQACFDAIASEHKDMMCAPEATWGLGCGGWGCSGLPGIFISADFRYEPADSEAELRQAPLANGLHRLFDDGVLGYEVSLQGNKCSGR